PEECALRAPSACPQPKAIPTMTRRPPRPNAAAELLGQACPPRISERAIKLPAIISVERLARVLGRSQAETRRLIADNNIRTHRQSGTQFANAADLRARLHPELSEAARRGGGEGET